MKKVWTAAARWFFERWVFCLRLSLRHRAGKF